MNAQPRNEAEARVALAACYRLIARLGLDDMICNHVSLRVPGTENEFLLNPYGLLFSEVTASSLVRIDTAGRKLDDTPYEVNVAVFVIHAAIHGARTDGVHDAACVLHTHSDASLAISGQEEGCCRGASSPCASTGARPSMTTKAWRSTRTSRSGCWPI